VYVNAHIFLHMHTHSTHTHTHMHIHRDANSKRDTDELSNQSGDRHGKKRGDSPAMQALKMKEAVEDLSRRENRGYESVTRGKWTPCVGSAGLSANEHIEDMAIRQWQGGSRVWSPEIAGQLATTRVDQQASKEAQEQESQAQIESLAATFRHLREGPDGDRVDELIEAEQACLLQQSGGFDSHGGSAVRLFYDALESMKSTNVNAR
jgi:hypothetical protein